MVLTQPLASMLPLGSFLQHRGLHLEVEELLQDVRVVSPGAQVGQAQGPAAARNELVPGLIGTLSSEPPSPTALTWPRQRGAQWLAGGCRSAGWPWGGHRVLDGEHPLHGCSLMRCRALLPPARAHCLCAASRCLTGSCRAAAAWISSTSPCLVGWGSMAAWARSAASRWHSPVGHCGAQHDPTAPLHPKVPSHHPNPCPHPPSLCCSSCWVLARISAMWRSWASTSSCGRCWCPCGGAGRWAGTSCCTGGCSGQEGPDPTSHGAGSRCPPRGAGLALPPLSSSWKRARPHGAGPSHGG